MTAWAEDRAPWRHDRSADPGAKTEGGRHDAALSFPFGIGIKAANRPNLILCTLYLISQPRFLHFTLNHYTSCRLIICYVPFFARFFARQAPPAGGRGSARAHD